MSHQMADPHLGMVSFQECLRKGILRLAPVGKHLDLFSHVDEPAPGERRLTYVRLSKDGLTVKAYVSCIMNGQVDGFPCIAVGYAVPEELRNTGAAKQILKDVVQDHISQAKRFGVGVIYVEAVVDVDNLPSQRVAAAVLGGQQERITELESGRPAFRYTARYETA